MIRAFSFALLIAAATAVAGIAECQDLSDEKPNIAKAGVRTNKVQAGKATPAIAGVPVDELLSRLGAKLESGVSRRELNDYVSHFNRIDLDRDGKHSREEYVDKGWYLTAQARAGIFRAADSDADGVVTESEYVLNRIITDEAKAIVQAMDNDNDGLVTQDEFVRASMRQLARRDMAKKVFKALDTNADGRIFVPEYLRVWGGWARAGRGSAKQRIAARKAELAKSTND